MNNFPAQISEGLKLCVIGSIIRVFFNVQA